MKKIIKLTESDLARIVKKVLKEENYSEEDLPYTHPKTGDSCKIKVALFKPAAEKGEMKYHAVLVCDYYGDEMITATLPVIKNSFEENMRQICPLFHRYKIKHMAGRKNNYDYEITFLDESNKSIHLSRLASRYTKIVF